MKAESILIVILSVFAAGFALIVAGMLTMTWEHGKHLFGAGFGLCLACVFACLAAAALTL